MKTKTFLAKLDHDRIVRAIGEAEKNTSGQIRIYIRHGAIDDPLAAARAQFQKLGMIATRERNAVLIFVAPRAQKFAVVGDEGIHQRCGDEFWQQLVDAMREDFRAENFTDALVHAIRQTGELLARYFPRAAGDGNQLPDEIEEG
ncbi:MAG TPA: DUF5130 family protein [Chthoniobacterales bacterium]|jgi:uncharacterized membrane protein